MLVQWDKESKIRNPERPKISDSYHSDICDAVLYAWRECKHFLSEKSIIPPKRGTDKYMDELEAKEAEKMKNRQSGDFLDLEAINDEIFGDDDYSDIF